jgi:glycine cleavage system H protein
MKYYSNNHEWVEIEGDVAKIGISEFAKSQSGEIVFIEFPKIEKQIKANEEVCVIESTKSALELYCPMSGKVIEINEKLKENLEIINTSPETDGWIFKLQISDKDEVNNLINEKDYLSKLNSN